METEQKSDTITISKNSLWKYSTFVLLGIIILGTAFFVLPGKSVNGNVVNDGTQAPNPNQRVTLSIGDAPVLGSQNAPVTVIEYSDFSCPYCAIASGDNEQLNAVAKQQFGANYEPIVSNVIKDYVDKGKVKFALKFSPGHSGGKPAQTVAWCLNEQNLFWKFYPLAFANQADVEDATKMKDLAKTISGVDTAKLQTCIDSKKYDARFDKEQNEGAQAGVRGTPAFFIGSEEKGFKLVSGAVPYAQAKSIIEAEL